MTLSIMVDKNKSKGLSICFICSPSLGMLDSWLSVIHQLRKIRPDMELTLILPQPSTVELIDLDNILTRLASSLVDRIIFRTFSGLWLKVNTFSEAKSINTLSPKMSRLLTFARRTSRFSLLKFVSKITYVGFRIFERKKYLARIVELNMFCSSMKAVLYDIHEEQKEYNKVLLDNLTGVPKFSIVHGICINLDEIVCRRERTNNREIKAYLYSEIEREYYKATFNLLDSDLSVVGIPKHNKKWIAKILAIGAKQDKLTWDNYVFLISRSMSPYFTYARKQKALEDMKRLVIDELGLNVIVKCHPKERNHGIFEKVFGESDYNKTWKYSNHHPFVLGKHCKFAISFFSGVAIDMIAIRVPTIEYLDLRGLQGFDDESSLRDAKGNPVSSYRYLGLNLGVSEYGELKSEVSNILNNFNTTMAGLTDNYQAIFGDAGESGLFIANDILQRIIGPSNEACSY